MVVDLDEASWRGHERAWLHSVADKIEEWRRFAAMRGLPRSFRQGPPRTASPHHGVTGRARQRALARRAFACTRGGIAAVLDRLCRHT
ncbi:MAG: DUF4031 domain-containing protein [Pseudolabrys sp.]|nr:DUF4031 domain-containing protein [Pseudolabrys sp.]